MKIKRCSKNLSFHSHRAILEPRYSITSNISFSFFVEICLLSIPCWDFSQVFVNTISNCFEGPHVDQMWIWIWMWDLWSHIVDLVYVQLRTILSKWKVTFSVYPCMLTSWDKNIKSFSTLNHTCLKSMLTKVKVKISKSFRRFS